MTADTPARQPQYNQHPAVKTSQKWYCITANELEVVKDTVLLLEESISQQFALEVIDLTEKRSCSITTFCEVCATHTSPPARTVEHMQSAYAHGRMDGAKAAREKMALEIIEWRHKMSKEFTVNEMWEMEQEHLESLRAQQQEKGVSEV